MPSRFPLLMVDNKMVRSMISFSVKYFWTCSYTASGKWVSETSVTASVHYDRGLFPVAVNGHTVFDTAARLAEACARTTDSSRTLEI
jgi:hypothetical protein